MCQQVRVRMGELSQSLLLTITSGVAHEMEADDVYKGYFLPKGTRILPLDW